MGQIDDLWRYDGRRVVVTGCASGIGEHVARQLIELGAEVVGLDRRRPVLQLKEFHEVDLADPASIGQAASAIGGHVDSLFNVAGVSSGIGDPLLVVTINFLGTRRFTEALIPTMPAGSSIVSVSSLAASGYLEHKHVTAGLVDTTTFDEGIEWCRRSPRCAGRRWLPAVEGSGHPVLHEECGPAGRSRYSHQLHRAGSDRDADPRPAAVGLRPGLSRHHPRSRWAVSQNPPNRRRSWSSSIAPPPATSPAKCCGSTAETLPVRSPSSLQGGGIWPA